MKIIFLLVASMGVMVLSAIVHAQGVAPSTTQPGIQPTTQPTTMPSVVKDPWLIIPCSSFGPIQANTSFADLARLFGKENIQDIQIEGPEGETYPGTVIFPLDATKKIQIIWDDAATKRSPVEISVRGDKSVWKTAQGITLGMGVKDLEKLNGRPFTISGFGWDYGGRVVSWDQGKLSALPKTLSLQLDTPGNAPAVVSGDKNLKTNLSALQSLNPKIVEISCTLH